jgi:hypothetical protein
MNASLTSTLSEFSKKSDFSASPLATEPSNKPSPPPIARNLITRARAWLDKLVAFRFARSLMMFFIGVAAALIWQWYGGMARKAAASWSPHLAWLAPGPPASSAERLKATSLALAAVRQDVDKLATEMSKLEAQGLPDGTSASSPSRQGSRRR